MVSRPALGVLLTAAQAALVSAQSCNSNNLSVSYPAPVAADGWNYRLVAEGLTRPRGILFDSTDGLVVVDAGHGLVHLSLKDEGGTCVSVAKKTTLVENENASSSHYRGIPLPKRLCLANKSFASSTMALNSRATDAFCMLPLTMTSTHGPTTPHHQGSLTPPPAAPLSLT